MDNNKQEVIEMILDRLILLDEFERKIMEALNFYAKDSNVFDEVSSIGFEGIPLILGVEETDELDNLFYNCLIKKISKKEYFKELEKYLREENNGRK